MTTTRSCVKRYLRATSGSTQEMPVLSALLKLFEAVCENQADRETHEKTSAFSVIESLFWLTETENYRVKRVAYRCRRQANLSPWKSRLGRRLLNDRFGWRVQLIAATHSANFSAGV